MPVLTMIKVYCWTWVQRSSTLASWHWTIASHVSVSDFVLGKFSKQELSQLPDFVNVMVEALEMLVRELLDKAASVFNGNCLCTKGWPLLGRCRALAGTFLHSCNNTSAMTYSDSAQSLPGFLSDCSCDEAVATVQAAIKRLMAIKPVVGRLNN